MNPIAGMAIISLPQTRGEIEAAAAEIIYTARYNFWTSEDDVQHRGTSRLLKANNIPTDCVVEDWLKRSSKMGAMEAKSLAISIDLALAPWSDDIKKLGGRRVVTIISRRRWRGATSAAAFMASR